MSKPSETTVQYGVQYPMFAEDKWGEGIYSDIDSAMQALGNPGFNGRKLYRREDRNSPWVEQNVEATA